MRARTAAALCALIFLFLALGWPFVTRLGIEVDEALVGNGIYERGAPWYSWRVGEYEIPVMLLPYLGALKTWLYNAIFTVWAPGPAPLRLPALLIGAGTLLLFFRLLDAAVDRTAAWFGTAMLATDPSFIILSAVDYGPVAIQHALKLGAMLLLVAFHRTRRPGRLAAACFLLGLAMWDKAVFSWFLAGLLIAGGAVFWSEVRAGWSWRALGAALAGFAAGALPWIVYNIARPLETYAGTARFSIEGGLIKLILLKRTLDGSGLFGFMTAPDVGPNPGVPRSAIQHVQFWVAGIMGHPGTSFTLIALAAAILALPLMWRKPERRAVVFALLLMTATWILMFVTSGAGGAVHHVALLWPFPAFSIAAVAAALLNWRRGWAVVAVLCASQILVMNTYHVALIRNGGSVRWSDAFGPLHERLRASRAETILIADWGILETLNLMSQGELPLLDASALLYPEAQPEALVPRLYLKGAVWVTHSAGREQWEGVNQALDQAARDAGVRRELLHTVRDRNGRSIFDILVFRRD